MLGQLLWPSVAPMQLGAWRLRVVDLVRAFQRQKNFRRKRYSRGLFSNR